MIVPFLVALALLSPARADDGSAAGVRPIWPTEASDSSLWPSWLWWPSKARSSRTAPPAREASGCGPSPAAGETAGCGPGPARAAVAAPARPAPPADRGPRRIAEAPIDAPAAIAGVLQGLRLELGRWPGASPELFEEQRQALRSAWGRVADRLLALDALAASAPEGAARRAAEGRNASVLALARAVSVPAAVALLNEPVAGLGLPRGAYVRWLEAARRRELGPALRLAGRGEAPPACRGEALERLFRDARPGDILLARREGALGEPGSGGWWRRAALFVGTPEERRERGVPDAFEAALNGAHPEAYWGNLDRIPEGRRRIVAVDERGVRLRSVESLGADSLALLRPRLPAPERLEAVQRAFDALGRPYDPLLQRADGAAFGSAALVLWAYAGRLRLEPRAPEAQGPAGADDWARTFDLQFGRPEAQYDLVDFFDARRGGASAPLEEFRRSWRRPRWAAAGAPHARMEE